MAIPNNTYANLLDNTQPIIIPFNLAPPSASSINIRRHSSHHCPIIDKVSDEQKLLQTKPVFPQIPPPVPKRNFQKSSETTPSPLKTPEPICEDTVAKNRANFKRASKRASKTTRNKMANCDNDIYNCSADQSSDDDLLSLESSVFEEGPVTNDAASAIFPNTKNFIKSNRSSSDSNKSQSTIDTGYMSNDNDRIFFGGNSDSYRSRFSSVDTQSSIDSSSDTQKCLNSPQPAIVHPQFSRSLNKYYSAAVGADTKINKIDQKRPPIVPMRKQTSIPKIPPPIVQQQQTSSPVVNNTTTTTISTTNLSRSSRGIPPMPPMRSQISLDSAKIFHSNQMLQHSSNQQPKIQQQQSLTNNKSNNCDNLQEMYSKPIIAGVGVIKNCAGVTTAATSGKQPFSQIHHTKLTQRQDSSLSSDSCSMTSSPGYNTKNSMEAPLLQYASKINKTTAAATGNSIRHQDSIDSFGMTAKYNFNGRGCNLRQDSNVSSDSFSQTSSPGYNTKLYEAPLLAHTVRLHASKFFFYSFLLYNFNFFFLIISKLYIY